MSPSATLAMTHMRETEKARQGGGPAEKKKAKCAAAAANNTQISMQLCLDEGSHWRNSRASNLKDTLPFYRIIIRGDHQWLLPMEEW